MTPGENPFAEPEDDDRTIIVPREQISALAARQQAMVVTPGAGQAPADTVDFTAIARGDRSPVLASAGSLLTLIARLRNVISVPDPQALRDRAAQEVERYGAALRQARLTPETIRIAHYVLCATLDDIVQATPWGSHGPWADLSLTSAFHRDVKGGERFFLILRKLLESPGAYIEVIELMYLCMSLGMQGQYRLMPRGPADWERVREETYATILRVRGATPADLSPHWLGLASPYKPLRFQVPVWMAAVGVLACLGVAYAFASLTSGVLSDGLITAAGALPPHAMPTIARMAPVTAPPETPQAPGLKDQIAQALQPEIQSGALSIAGVEAQPMIRLQSQGMFETGTATILPQYLGVLRRIGDVIGHDGGYTRIVGHTDAQPIHTVTYPSNYALSLARAQAAGAVLAPYVGADHISVEGRGAQAPISDNTSEAGRRANRRVEIAVFGKPVP